MSEGELLTRVAAEFAGAQVLTLVPERDDERRGDERDVATTTGLQPALVGAAGQKPGVVALAA